MNGRSTLVIPAIAAVLLAGCGSSGQQSASGSPTATPSATHSPTYPPKTVADLKALAATGDASAVHEVKSEGVGLASCPQPKHSVVVASSVSDPKQIAASLLNYFYAQGFDNECGSLVLAYANQSEIGGPYTVGQVALNVNSGSPKHDLMVNVGNSLGSTSLSIEVNY